MEEEIRLLANQAIEDCIFPGCVVGFVKKDGKRAVFPFGKFTYEEGSQEVREDTIYDVASITKSIPTGSLALQLIDEGRLKLEDKLIDYIPEFRNSDRDSVLIKHLLTYTLDGYGLASLKANSSDELLEILLIHDFNKRPGEVFKYTNIPAALLGLVIEKIEGDTLDNIADRRFFNPLEMDRSTFYPNRFPKSELVPTEIDDWRGLVHGVVHDESAYIFKKSEKVVGYAGLFTTAPDVLNFLEMLLNGGTLNGRKYFSEETVKLMGENQITELNDFTGLGWELNQPRYMGKYAGENTFGKTGFTGTLCICDVKKEIAYVILSNRTYPKRHKDSSRINEFRASIGEILLK